MKVLEERMEKLTCEVSVNSERDELVDCNWLTEFESCSLRKNSIISYIFTVFKSVVWSS